MECRQPAALACPQCPQRFKHEWYLRQHLARAHRAGTAGSQDSDLDPAPF